MTASIRTAGRMMTLNSVSTVRQQTNPFLLEPAIIPGLPDGLQVVPDDPDEWLEWRDDVRIFRELTRRETKRDKKRQRMEWSLCERDPAYWLVMYGVIFEPRSVAGNPPAWFPWVPFAFQVRMIRWIQHVMEQDAHGRGDGIIEKSRDMGASWIFCAYMAHQWLFSPVFIGGLVSRNMDAVDQTNSSDTLFFKIRALLGLLDQVPGPLRLPGWMIPTGMNDDLDTKAHISHPSKTCIIQGETTTGLVGVGGRATMRVNDEAARFVEFNEAWGNQAAVTNHRFAVSSADLRAPKFRELARIGKEGLTDPELEAPSYLRLDWWIHPFHTQEWLSNERARAADKAEFEREYEISYTAGRGDRVYHQFQNADLGTFPYDPTIGTLYCTIDPGVADPTSIIWIQEDRPTGRFRVIDGFEGDGSEDAGFYASVLTGQYVSGVGGYDYGKYPELTKIMEWTGSLNRPVQYFGDHAGTHRGGDGKRSFYEALTEESSKLTNGKNPIYVRTVTADGARTHAVRKNAVQMLAHRMDFNNTPGANAVLTALKESMYPRKADGRTFSRESVEPQHDMFSHRRTAMEFWAVNMEQETHVRHKGVARPARVYMSGRLRK